MLYMVCVKQHTKYSRNPELLKGSPNADKLRTLRQSLKSVQGVRTVLHHPLLIPQIDLDNILAQVGSQATSR
jgi:hypothetical protein